MKKYFILLLCLLAIIVPVFGAGVYYTGTIGQDSGWIQTNYMDNTTNGLTGLTRYFGFNDIENSQGSVSYIHFDAPGTHASFTAGAPAHAETTFNITYLSQVIATGTVGYQRNYDTAWPIPNEIAGYQYYIFDTWNITGLSGDYSAILNYNASAIYGMDYTTRCNSGTTSLASGTGGIYRYDSLGPSNYLLRGTHTWNRNYVFENTYVVQQGEDTLLYGIISKSSGGNVYNSRGMVFRSDTGALIASEGTSTANDFEFMSIPRNIIVAARDSQGTIWNSSVLAFSPGGTITPTPTPTSTGTGEPTITMTPVVTPTGGTDMSKYSDATFTFIDYETDLPMPNVYVQLSYNDFTMQGYTNAAGIWAMDNADVGANRLRANAAGYNNIDETHYITPYTYSTNVYMYPDTGGGTPDRINITVTVRNANGGALLSGVDTVIVDSKTNLYNNLMTDGSGVAQFNNIKNSPNLHWEITKMGYEYNEGNVGYLPPGDIALTLYMTPSTTFVPTPTPPTYATVSLAANPNSVSVGETVTLTTTCTGSGTCAGPNANIVTYYSKPLQSSSATLIGMYKYNITSAGWDFRTSNAAPWLVGSYNQLTITNAPALTDTYTYSVFVTNNKSVSIGTASAIVVVGGGAVQGGLVMKLFAGDKATTSQLGNYYLNLTNDITGEFTDIGFVAYNYDKLLPRGTQFTLQCNKTGYIDGSAQFTVPTDIGIVEGSIGALQSCMMFPVGQGPSPGNTSVAVHVSDENTFFPIGRVLITITATGQTISPRYTGDDGSSALFLIPYNTAYLVKAEKTGYCSASDSGNTGTDSYQYVSLYMKAGSCAIVTPTPTTSITSTPSVTPIGGWGQPSNQTAYVCNKAPLNPSYVDIILNTLACNGFKDVQSQNIGISMLIIILLALILGKVAGGLGVLSGAIVGTLLSIVMGFLPFWIVIVLIIIAGLVIASKIYSGE